MSIISTFDPLGGEIIRPYSLTHPVDNFPDIAVGVFSYKAMELVAEMPGAVNIAAVKSAVKPFPIYRISRGGRDIAVYQTPVGGAPSVIMMEELAAFGAKTFLIYGSCGCLDPDIAAGRLIVPFEAYRDEGVSYHYAPAGDYIAVNGAVRLTEVFESMNVPHVAARTWSTDAIYRETRANMEKRRAEGCKVVEMECAALAACADFRGLRFAQFLYAADSLAGEKWDARTLGATPEAARRAYLDIALEAAARL